LGRNELQPHSLHEGTAVCGGGATGEVTGSSFFGSGRRIGAPVIGVGVVPVGGLCGGGLNCFLRFGFISGD